MSFVLHPQLAADFHVLGRSGNLQVLLRRNAVLPWFLLVPECAALELYELTPPLRRELDTQTDRLAPFVKHYFACDKMNIAAIGNIVPQLHLHVIGRRVDDCCWPQAAWGHVVGIREYTTQELAAIVHGMTNLPGFDFVPEGKVVQ
jgi:diadenosine tetraphosphate (Ap4A) HIT family hydrolase